MNAMLDLRHQPAERDDETFAAPQVEMPAASPGEAVTFHSSSVPQLAVPRRGHVLSRVAEIYGEPVRETVSVLSGSLARKRQCASLYETLFPSTGPWQPTPGLVRPPAEMAAWAIVSIWVTGVATGAIPVTATLAIAEDWFFGQETPERLTPLPSARAIGEAESILHEVADPSAYRDLLPYILDPHGPGSRLSVRRDPGTRAARARKRAEGVFYTPADVAHYMVVACLDSIGGQQPVPVFDPACGTGVFLRAALAELRNRHPAQEASRLAAECLFGTDIDPWPLNAAAFVLLAETLIASERNSQAPAVLWRRLRRNFSCIDTLRLDPAPPKDTRGSSAPASLDDTSEVRVPLSRLFPALEKGPRVIVGNPPYANLGQRNDFTVLGSRFQTLAVKTTPTAEIYLPFLEQMTRLIERDQCAGALVLPLSLACNVGAQFAAARALIAQKPGRWRFAFFDREPHALFGEDVKMRNAIVLWSKGPADRKTSIATGPLRKWRGDSRAAMFQSLRFTPIETDIRSGIPKIGGARQAAALKALSGRLTQLESAVTGIGRATLDQAPRATDKTVFVGPTAYNFLNVFFKPPRGLLSAGQSLSEHPLHAIDCATREEALAVFAILSSHLAYWWWHAHGDGFHVSRRTIASFPFGIETISGRTLARLAAHGAELWSTICASPVISLNRAKISLAFTPNGHDELRRNADEILAEVADLDRSFVDELQQFTVHTVAATLRAHGSGTPNESEGE